MIPPRIKSITVLNNFRIKILYVNGQEKIYDMKKNLDYNFYSNLNNPSYFQLAKSVGTTIEWPNGEDIDPNELYENSIIYSIKKQ